MMKIGLQIRIPKKLKRKLDGSFAEKKKNEAVERILYVLQSEIRKGTKKPAMFKPRHQLFRSIQKFHKGRTAGVGTSLVYALQRELGGPIKPKPGGYLHFKAHRDGKWVKTSKTIHQKGSHYFTKGIKNAKPGIEKILRELGKEIVK